MANEVLGYCPCPSCDGEVEVMQAKRQGKHLYSRCRDGCGLDQRTGKKPQQWLWDNTSWIDGPPVPPENVTVDSVKESTEKPSNNAGSVDFDPEEKPAEEQPKKQPKGGIFKVLALGIAVLTVGGAVWKA